MFEPLRLGMNGMQGKDDRRGGDGGMTRQTRPAAIRDAVCDVPAD